MKGLTRFSLPCKILKDQVKVLLDLDEKQMAVLEAHGISLNKLLSMSQEQIDRLEKISAMSQETIDKLGGINFLLKDVLNLKCVSSTLDVFSLQITFPILFFDGVFSQLHNLKQKETSEI